MERVGRLVAMDAVRGVSQTGNAHTSPGWLSEKVLPVAYDYFREILDEELENIMFGSIICDETSRNLGRTCEMCILVVYIHNGIQIRLLKLARLDILDADAVYTALKTVLVGYRSMAWWGDRVVIFGVDGASVLGSRGKTNRRLQAVNEKSVMAHLKSRANWQHVRALREVGHLVMCQLRHALREVTSHEKYDQAVIHATQLYRSGVLFRELERRSEHVETKDDTGKGVVVFPPAHRIRFAQADLARNTAFLRNLMYVVAHLAERQAKEKKAKKKKMVAVVRRELHTLGIIQWAMFIRAVLQAADQVSRVGQARNLTGAHMQQVEKDWESRLAQIKGSCSRGMDMELTDGMVWRGIQMRPQSEEAQRALKADQDLVMERLATPLEVDPNEIQTGVWLTDHGPVTQLAAEEVDEYGNSTLKEVAAEWRSILVLKWEQDVADDDLVEQWRQLKERYRTEFKNMLYSEVWLVLDQEPRTPLLIVMCLLRTLTCQQAECERVNDRLRRATHRGAGNKKSCTLDKILFLQYTFPTPSEFWKVHALPLARRILAENPDMRIGASKRCGRARQSLTAIARVEQRMLECAGEAVSYGHAVPSAWLKEVVALPEAEDVDGEGHEDPFEACESEDGSVWSGSCTDDEDGKEERDLAEEVLHHFERTSAATDCPMCRKRSRVWCKLCGCCQCQEKTMCEAIENQREDLHFLYGTLAAAALALVAQERMADGARQGARQKLAEILVADPTLKDATRSSMGRPLGVLGYRRLSLNRKQMMEAVWSEMGHRKNEGDLAFEGPQGCGGRMAVTTRAQTNKKGEKARKKAKQNGPPASSQLEENFLYE